MKLKPDNSPMLNLSQHRTPQEYEQSSVLRELARAALLFAFGACLIGGYLWAVFNLNIMHP